MWARAGGGGMRDWVARVCLQNSFDQLHRQDLGGDVHNDNPAEELNR